MCLGDQSLGRNKLSEVRGGLSRPSDVCFMFEHEKPSFAPSFLILHLLEHAIDHEIIKKWSDSVYFEHK